MTSFQFMGVEFKMFLYTTFSFTIFCLMVPLFRYSHKAWAPILCTDPIIRAHKRPGLSALKSPAYV